MKRKVVLISSLLVVCSVVGFSLMFVHFSGLVTYYRIIDHGSRTVGAVVERESFVYQEGDSHLVKYEFRTPNGDLLTKTCLSKRLWDELKLGDSIEIAFDPDNPTNNIPTMGPWLPVLGLSTGLCWLQPMWALILISLFGVLVFLVIEGALIIWLLGNLHKLRW
jgi:hypothetical protein